MEVFYRFRQRFAYPYNLVVLSTRLIFWLLNISLWNYSFIFNFKIVTLALSNVLTKGWNLQMATYSS